MIGFINRVFKSYKVTFFGSTLILSYLLILLILFAPNLLTNSDGQRHTQRSGELSYYSTKPGDQSSFNCNEYAYDHDQDFQIVERKQVTDDADEQEILLRLDNKKYLQKLTGETNIVAYSYSPESNTAAYITRFGDKNSNGGQKDRVYLYILNEDSKKLIYEHDNTYYEGSEYSIKLRDIGFSEDGLLLAITSSESLRLYDLRSNEIYDLFTIERDPEPIHGVGGYFSPKFSGDNSKILISVGYYEGSGGLVYDRESDSITDLDYFIYSSGENAVGWYQDDLVVLKRGIEGTEEEDSSNGLYIVSFPDLEEELVVRTDAADYGGYVEGNYYYRVDRVHEQSEQYICNNFGRLTKATSVHETLYGIDLTSGELKEILRVDATDGLGKVDILRIDPVGDGSVYLKMRYRGIEYFELNVNSPNKLTKIEFS